MESLLERIISTPSLGAIWVAQSGTKLVGYLVAVFIMSLEHRGLMAEIDELFVVPEARARGAGQTLLFTAEQRLMQKGCVRVQLQLGIDNEAARGFYLRNGYEGRAGFELLDKSLR
jgi:ribosomal protein S18 acetylase RimI-like enzyme